LLSILPMNLSPMNLLSPMNIKKFFYRQIFQKFQLLTNLLMNFQKF